MSRELRDRTNDADYTVKRQASFLVALSVILYHGNLDVLVSKFLCPAFLINLKSHSVAGHQSAVVATGPHEASIMRSVARAPTFIQLSVKANSPG